MQREAPPGSRTEQYCQLECSYNDSRSLTSARHWSCSVDPPWIISEKEPSSGAKYDGCHTTSQSSSLYESTVPGGNTKRINNKPLNQQTDIKKDVGTAT